MVVEWDKDDCSDMGIVKVDLLGLGMMAVLKDTVQLVGDHYGERECGSGPIACSLTTRPCL